MWSGLRESNPSSWLGKPEHYHYAKPASVKADCTTAANRNQESGIRSQSAVKARFTLTPNSYLLCSRDPRSSSNHVEHFVAFLLHQLRRLRLQVQAQQRFRVRRAYVEMPVRVIHGDAIERRETSVPIPRLDGRELARHVVHIGQLGVDFTGDEVALAVRLKQLAERLVLLRHELQDEERRNEPVVRVGEVAEIVVSGHLAAEDRVLLAHPALDERVTDAVHQRAASEALDRVLDRAAGAEVVDDGCSRVLQQEGLGQQRRDEIP